MKIERDGDTLIVTELEKPLYFPELTLNSGTSAGLGL